MKGLGDKEGWEGGREGGSEALTLGWTKFTLMAAFILAMRKAVS